MLVLSFQRTTGVIHVFVADTLQCSYAGCLSNCLHNSIYILLQGRNLSSDALLPTQAALTLARTDKSIMSKNMKKTEAILREMVMITLRSELTKIQRTNLETCITIHMHQKESTGEFADVQRLCYWASQHCQMTVQQCQHQS